MDDRSAAFTVAFPEAKKIRTARSLAATFFLVFWILWGVSLFGAPRVPDRLWLGLVLIPFVMFLAITVYVRRKQKELASVINQRFAEEFASHTQEDYPTDVDILKVQRSLAIKKADGSVRLWGVKRKKDVFIVFPMA